MGQNWDNHDLRAIPVVVSTACASPLKELGAGGGGRTHTPRRERDFESRASASFTTPAQRGGKRKAEPLVYQPMRHRLWLAALVWLVTTPASAQWVRIDSPNFTFFGEIGDKRTHEYAAEFERFREALGRLVPGAALRAAVP